MIRLTHTSGKSVYIMPDNIVDFFQTDTGDTLITFVAGHGYRVKESPEEVARKIINYKTSMIDFNNYSAGVVRVLIDNHLDVYEELRSKYDYIVELAGLEE